jgi:hypothetical protein
VNLPAPLSGLGETSVPFQRIADRGQHFAELARVARIERPSLLDADLGGTSYRTGLAIIDLAGLGDREVARAMREHRYGPEFIEHYVFARRKPTFIHHHEPWSSMSGIERTQGLTRDYLPIAAVPYRPLLKTLQAALPSERNYVRIDAITDASFAPAPPQVAVSGVSVLALESRQDCVRVVFRLARPLPAGTRARFVVERAEHPLLYGWTPVEALRPGLPFVQFVPAQLGQTLSLAVDDEHALIPGRVTARVR